MRVLFVVLVQCFLHCSNAFQAAQQFKLNSQRPGLQRARHPTLDVKDDYRRLCSTLDGLKADGESAEDFKAGFITFAPGGCDAENTFTC